MSITSTDARVHPVAEALAGVTADAPVWSLSDADLETALDGCERALSRVAELRLRLVADADARDLGRRLGAASTAAWLRHRFRTRLGHARALVDTAGRIAAGTDTAGPADYAADVAGPPTGREMPATGAALAAGEISEPHATTICSAMARLPEQLDPAAGAEAECQFVELARRYDPAVLAKMLDCLIDALSADTLAADETDAVNRRELRLSEHTGKITGRFDPEALAMIRAMLDPLAAPHPADEGSPDTRSGPRRMADALVEIARRVLNHTDWLPTNHGTRPHVTIVTELTPDTDNTNQADDNSPADSDAHPGATADSDNTAAHSDSGADGDAQPAEPAEPAVPPEPAVATGTGASGGRPRFGRGEPTWGRPLSAATIGRIACDAGITWIITNPDGVPLNVGREHRTVTPAQWAALLVRDGGCVFPGCTRTPEWCEAHHIIWWRHGGRTDIDNLCLLCNHHHRAVHHDGWNIELATDGKTQFIPPTWVDPDQTPLRNTRPRLYRNKSPS